MNLLADIFEANREWVGAFCLLLAVLIVVLLYVAAKTEQNNRNKPT